MIRYFLLVLLYLLALRPLSAQQAEKSPFDQLKRETDQELSTPSSSRHMPNPSEAQLRYNEAYWNYQTKALDHRRQVFAWQHKSSIGIFAVVVLIVLSGVGFSGVQFYIAARSVRTARVAPATGTVPGIDELPAAISSNIEVSTAGIKITSSVLGIIILTLSIVFFFLYIKYVYPIAESPNLALQQDGSAAPAAPATAPAAPAR